MGGGAQHFQAAARFGLVLEHGLVLEEDIGKAQNGHQCVVEVMGNSGGHLAKSAQTFMLNDLLLRGLKFGQRLFKLTIDFPQITLGFFPQSKVFGRSGNDPLYRF